MAPKKRVGILISGRGSNMMSLVEAALAPDYPAEIVVVVSNRPEAAGLAWAKAQGIPAIGLDHKHYRDRSHFEGQLHSLLVASRVELVCCAGFMRLMTPEFVEKWRDRMLNIHPSLLPSFKGLDTHERALEAGVTIAGCTVHVVRAEMDAGPIIAQGAVPVMPGDTPDSLAARILHIEHKIYPQALRAFALGQVRVVGERVEHTGPINQPPPLISPGFA